MVNLQLLPLGTQAVSSFCFQKRHTLSHEEQERVGRVRGLILHNDFSELGKLLAQQNRPFLKHVKNIFRNECVPLFRALTATDTVIESDRDLGISYSRVIQVALFIETEFAARVAQREYYIPGRRTHSGCVIEYDPASRKTIIYSENKADGKLGSGCKKVVSKAILYDVHTPEIVALSRTEFELRKEIRYTRALQGAHGIAEIRTIIRHERVPSKLLFIFKLYNAGALKNIFENGTYTFTLQEKMKIAADLLQGLKAMHDKSLVHCDSHSGNFLVHVTKKNEKREVQAVITDFGRTLPKKSMQGVQPQPDRRYRAPECYFHETLSGDDYEYTDIFALGCIFYQLFYERDPDWWSARAFFTQRRTTTCEIQSEQRAFIQSIQRTIGPRKRALNGCCFSPRLSQEEQFEALILRMLDPTSRARGRATELVQEMERICTIS